jgi:UDP-N-acetyl-2-amino-2-deoxyglucuronate dehydrogenase
MITHPPLSDLRFGIIGSAAGIAASHLKALTQLPGASVCWNGGCRHQARRSPAPGRSGAHSLPTTARCSKTVRPDVAVICAPHPFHAALAIDCLEAGAHVLVEKPLAVSVSEADAMIAAADRAGRLLAVCFQQRFSSGY